jgi:O-antigen/teichoic acid export membrane protein
MIKRLIHNTVISIIAFGGAALLGLVVIPVIIRGWGVTEFGLIVITRLLLPTGMMAVFDLGLSEVATQAVARAREHRDWDLAARQLSFLNALSLVLAVTVSGAIWFGTPWLTVLMKVDAVHLERFKQIMHVTALANLILVPSLVFEGIVKGFERYNLLRITELASTLGYVALTIWASSVSAGFEVVAYIYLGSLVLRALIVLAGALVALGTKHARPARWTAEIRHELFHRCMLLLQGKLIGGITGPIQPFVVGLLFGPNSVGIYDALVRLSRVSKVVVGLLTSALLPVASRLDQRGNTTSFQRLGELGLIMLPMFTVPPLAAAAILSHGIMDVWIGKALLPYAFWMGLSFLIPICTQYLAIGNLLFLTRPEVQARLNMLLGIQLAIWAIASAATLMWFSERALILGQVVASLAVLPWQLETLRGALGLDRDRFARAIGTQAAVLLLGSLLLWIFAGYIHPDSVLMLCLISGIFCLLTWVAQYFLVLEKRHRAIFPAVGSLMGLAPKSN